jgi:hypothetical protein
MVAVVMLMLRLLWCGVNRWLIRQVWAILFFVLEEWHFDSVPQLIDNMIVI